MKSLSNRRCKENPGLINGPSDRAPPPNPEVNRCLELRWALHRARVGVVGPTRAADPLGIPARATTVRSSRSAPRRVCTEKRMAGTTCDFEDERVGTAPCPSNVASDPC